MGAWNFGILSIYGRFLRVLCWLAVVWDFLIGIIGPPLVILQPHLIIITHSHIISKPPFSLILLDVTFQCGMLTGSLLFVFQLRVAKLTRHLHLIKENFHIPYTFKISYSRKSLDEVPYLFLPSLVDGCCRMTLLCFLFRWVLSFGHFFVDFFPLMLLSSSCYLCVGAWYPCCCCWALDRRHKACIEFGSPYFHWWWRRM